MNKERKISLLQKVSLGTLELKLSEEEVTILQLVSCANDEALPLWKKLWQNTKDYEDFSFSCKELMPSAVKKIQSCVPQEIWQSVVPNNANFLVGLPRYTWTKNQYILNQYRIIAKALNDENIECIAIKGVGEILANSHLSMMRTSRDIDILIQPEDWEKSKKIFADLGWKMAITKHEFDFLNSPIEPHAETFYNKEGIMDLDVHFSAIGGPKSFAQNFTKKLWERKISSAAQPHLLIPSLEDRLIISAANAYKIHTWKTEQTCKYLYDALLNINFMNAAQIEKACAHAEQYLTMGNNMQNLMNCIHQINDNNFYKSKESSSYFKMNVSSSFIVKLIYFKHLTNLLKLVFSGVYTLQALYFIAQRMLNSLFIRLPKKVYKKLFSSKAIKKEQLEEKNRITWHLLHQR